LTTNKCQYNVAILQMEPELDITDETGTNWSDEEEGEFTPKIRSVVTKTVQPSSLPRLPKVEVTFKGPMKCPACADSPVFARLDGFQRHWRETHTQFTRKHVCPMLRCTFKCKRPRGIKDHIICRHGIQKENANREMAGHKTEMVRNNQYRSPGHFILKGPEKRLVSTAETSEATIKPVEAPMALTMKRPAEVPDALMAPSPKRVHTPLRTVALNDMTSKAETTPFYKEYLETRLQEAESRGAESAQRLAEAELKIGLLTQHQDPRELIPSDTALLQSFAHHGRVMISKWLLAIDSADARRISDLERQNKLLKEALSSKNVKL
jgi:hypothetical protein